MARTRRGPDPLRELLTARGEALDSTLPTAAFVLVWLVAGPLGLPQPLLLGGGAAVAVAAGVAVWRLRRGERPRGVAIGLLIAVVAAAIAFYTGDAVDFFLPRIISNAGSLVAWLVSIAVRWPLLGLVVGAVLRRPTAWRADPALVRGYSRASWVWAGQYAVRLAVWIPLWASGALVALGIATAVLSWPLVALCVLASWPLVSSALPPGHPGPRHPVTPGAPGEDPA